MACKHWTGFAVCALTVLRSSSGAKWVIVEKYDEGDTTCSGTPTKKVSPWALEDTCLSVGTAQLRDWMVQGGDGSQELYVKVSCTDEIVTETVYSDQSCTTLAVSGNGKNSSASQSRSCAEHDVPWSFFDKFGYTKFHCGNEYPLLAWAEFSDEACQTRSDKGVKYEADGACYSFEGVENWVGDGMNSKKATCSDGKVAWVSYASPDCSGSIVETSELAPVACSFSNYHNAHVKLVDGECTSAAVASTQRTTFGALLAFVLSLAQLMLPQEQQRPCSALEA